MFQDFLRVHMKLRPGSCGQIVMPSEDPPAKRRARRAPVTQDRLHRAALAYLARHAASTWSVRQVLGRRIQRAAAEHETDPAAAQEWVDAVIARLTRAGLLDDAAFAANRARTLFERGLPPRMIRMKLAEKGVGDAECDAALAAIGLDHDDPDMAAAIRFARRRRLGPFARDGAGRTRDKELAAMARAGFGYRTASRVLEAAREALEDGDPPFDR